MMIIKIVGVGIVALCAVLFLKTISPSLAMLTGSGCALVMVGMTLVNIEGFISYYYQLCVETGYGDYFKVMLKGLGVAFITQIGSDICRDNGEFSLGSHIEFAGKAEILVITMPLVKSLVLLSESILTK
ncbi:MAG: hypothetical protein IKU52_00285 [Clostridia bacterium]|nr:hypothetical protein [Clostridia bacterium]